MKPYKWWQLLKQGGVWLAVFTAMGVLDALPLVAVVLVLFAVYWVLTTLWAAVFG